MDLSREILEREIVGTKAAIKSNKESIAIHEIVLEGFEKELKKLPKAKPAEKKL